MEINGSYFHCRKNEMDTLHRIAGFNYYKTLNGSVIYDESSPLIILYGYKNTGKSFYLTQLITNYKHAFLFVMIDCNHIYSIQEFYRDVLEKLYLQTMHSSTISQETFSQELYMNPLIIDIQNKKSPMDSIEIVNPNEMKTSLNFLSFVKSLQTYMEYNEQEGKDKAKRLYFILDHIEALFQRQMTSLLTCLFTLNDQLEYASIQDKHRTWNICTILITRAMSLECERLVQPFFPVYIHFPPYTQDQVREILTRQLHIPDSQAIVFKKWLNHLYELLTLAPVEWIKFRQFVVQYLSLWYKYFPRNDKDAPVANAIDPLKQLTRETTDAVKSYQQLNRQNILGFESVKAQESNSNSMTSTIGSTDVVEALNLRPSTLLLLLACYLASFNPQESDINFISGNGMNKKRKRPKKLEESAIESNQLLIGPKMFKLQRLLAIYRSLWKEHIHSDTMDQMMESPDSIDSREDTFTHLSTLIKLQLVERTTGPSTLDDIRYRCLANTSFTLKVASYLQFPLQTYLNPT